MCLSIGTWNVGLNQLISDFTKGGYLSNLVESIFESTQSDAENLSYVEFYYDI